jgi:hypothetical protein
MTLVVARCENGRIGIAADTLLSEHDSPLAFTKGVVKSCCLPGYICVSFSGSPELAGKAFTEFQEMHPRGANFETTVKFFESSSSLTNNDYLIAFGHRPKLVTIRNGRRTSGLSKTHWIGDKSAYEKFRELEHRERRRSEHGRAVNAAVFADEMTGSPASELHGIMRNVVQDADLPTIGGFVSVLSNRDIGFRYSVYSDVLLDWPKELVDGRELELSDKFDLSASGETSVRISVHAVPDIGQVNAHAFSTSVETQRRPIGTRGPLLFVRVAGSIPGCSVTPGVTLCRPSLRFRPIAAR